MIGEWKSALAANAENWGLPTDGKWSFILRNNYLPTCSTVNLFWFHDAVPHPLVVTKIFPESVSPQQELRNLQVAYSFAPTVVPKPLGLFSNGRFWALWMAGMAGERLIADALSDAIVDNLCDALITVQKGAAKQSAAACRQPDSIRAPLTSAGLRCPAIAQSCELMLARYSEGAMNRYPSLPQHGDLYGDNIIISAGGQVGIVDWEYFGSVDLPYYDVIQLLFSFGSATTPTAWSDSVRKYGRRLISRYADALGYTVQDLMFLLPLLLANWLFGQPLEPGKVFVQSMLQDYLARPNEWERALVT